MNRRLFLTTLSSVPLIAAPKPVEPIDEAGYQRLIARHKGQVLLVDFWATWCAPCRKELPEVAELAKKYRAKGLRVALISCDEPEKKATAALVLESLGIADPGYLKQAKDDDRFISAVNPKWGGALPAVALYLRDGKLGEFFLGDTPTAKLEAAIQKALG